MSENPDDGPRAGKAEGERPKRRSVPAPVPADEAKENHMSQAAIASFIYGTVQMAVTPFAIATVFVLHSVSHSVSLNSQILTGLGIDTEVPSSAVLHAAEIIILVGSNLFAVLGFLTSLVALVQIKQGMRGDALALVGMSVSIGCAAISLLLTRAL